MIKSWDDFLDEVDTLTPEQQLAVRLAFDWKAARQAERLHREAVRASMSLVPQDVPQGGASPQGGKGRISATGDAPRRGLDNG
jgi:hypothetical protein